MSIDEHILSDPVEPEDMVYGGDLTHPFLLPSETEAAREQFVGRRFITPQKLVIEVLKEMGGELKCRYLSKNPDGNMVDFTVRAARKILISV